jgi:hypothetical protein
MSNGSFEKDSLGWQLSQLQQRFGEWWELQLSRFSPNPSKASLPSWWNSPMIQMLAKAAFWLILALLLTWIGLQIWRWLRPYLYSLTHSLNQSLKKSPKHPPNHYPLRVGCSDRKIPAAGSLSRSLPIAVYGNVATIT